MKHILVLGAGRVARPCVQYLLKRADVRATVVDVSEANLARVTRDLPRASAVVADATRQAAALLAEHRPDAVISLLPAVLMPGAVRACLAARTPLVQTSYADATTLALDADAQAAGVPLLVELGLDPGIDHMSAARGIARIHAEGGVVRGFRSICGAIPSLQANTNPWGYKLSWAPASLIGASQRDARVRLDGHDHFWPHGKTFEHAYLEEVAGLGWFEVYANADSLPYLEAYGIPDARTIYRGTIRYVGWSETICAMNALGLVEQAPMDFSGWTFREWMRHQAGGSGTTEAETAVCAALAIRPASAVFMRLKWLGLLDDAPIPSSCKSARDVIALLFDRKLVYSEGEQDMVILQDEIIAEFPARGRTERRTMTLIDYGVPGGDSSIARTTGIPAAIAALLVADGRVTRGGVLRPVLPEIYGPTLDALEAEGIRMVETVA